MRKVKIVKNKVTKIALSGALVGSLIAGGVVAIIDKCHRLEGASHIAERIEESGLIPENFGVYPSMGASKVVYMGIYNQAGNYVHKALTGDEAQATLEAIKNSLVDAGFTEAEFISYMDYKYDYGVSFDEVNFLDVWDAERSSYWENKSNEVKGRH